MKLLTGARLLPSWRRVIAIVQPATVLRSHRAGFRRLASSLPSETIDLSPDVASRGRRWGAERIRGEILLATDR